MKAALFTPHFPPHFKAGVEQYVLRLARELKHQGNQVEIVCLESISKGSLTPKSSSDTYAGLPVKRLFIDMQKAPDMFRWSFKNPQLGEWVKHYLQDSQPDIIHVNSGYLLGGSDFQAAFEQRIPTVLTLHDFWFLCPLITLLRPDGRICSRPVPPSQCVWCQLQEKRRFRLPDRFLKGTGGNLFVQLMRSKIIAGMSNARSKIERMNERREYLKKILEQIDLVLSPSCFLIRKIEEYGMKPRQIKYLPLGINKERLEISLSEPAPGRIRFGYLGQIVPHKGVHLLIKAFKNLKKTGNSCELVLYGQLENNAPYGQKLIKLSAEAADIRFAGPYDNQEIGNILSQLDVVIVPSVWYENRPTVILECQVAKIPVIAADVGGILELIDHERNRFLFKSGSNKALQQIMQRILDHPDLLDKISTNIQPVKSMQEEVTELNQLYLGLLRQKQKRDEEK